MINFAKRNLKVFFRDKSSVFFSLLAVFIIIGLYALFLGDVWVNSFQGMTGVRYLMDSWIMAGLLAVTSVTTTMGAFGIMVEDKAKKTIKDFTSSPIKRSSIAGGYIISSFAIGIILSIITVILAEIYILANGGELMSFITLLKVLGLILLATFTNTSMVLFIVSFFKSSKCFCNRKYNYRYNDRISDRHIPAVRTASLNSSICCEGLPRFSCCCTFPSGFDGGADKCDLC